MKKIMMNKYGFERWPEQDFNDDGNRFTCFKAGARVRVSKTTSNGQAYISARIDDIKLPFEEYSKLPHFRALDKLNGVSIESLNDSDLITLYNDCLAYEKEYTDAENSIVMPTLEEIKEHCRYICGARQNELIVIEHLLKTNISILLTSLSDYKWSDIKSYYIKLQNEIKNYDENTYAKRILGTSYSIDFCKANNSLKKESYYYGRLMEIIESAVLGGK